MKLFENTKSQNKRLKQAKKSMILEKQEVTTLTDANNSIIANPDAILAGIKESHEELYHSTPTKGYLLQLFSSNNLEQIKHRKLNKQRRHHLSHTFHKTSIETI